MAKAEFIVFFSTKGGVGKTLLSANLAVALRKESSPAQGIRGQGLSGGF